MTEGGRKVDMSRICLGLGRTPKTRGRTLPTEVERSPGYEGMEEVQRLDYRRGRSPEIVGGTDFDGSCRRSRWSENYLKRERVSLLIKVSVIVMDFNIKISELSLHSGGNLTFENFSHQKRTVLDRMSPPIGGLSHLTRTTE